MEVLTQIITDEQSQSIYRGGTLDGLMKLIGENNGVALGAFDELCTFTDNIDKGCSGNLERGKSNYILFIARFRHITGKHHLFP